MKSRTSFFNTTALGKDLTRFAPSWILYTVLQLMILVLLAGQGNRTYSFSASMADTMAPMAFVNMVYAFLNAQLLLGDLFNNRMCNALHAMPIRREGWFLTHVGSGLLFSLAPNALVSLLSFLICGGVWQIPLLWLGAVILQYLFFFGVAVLSAYCVGNRFGMLLVYGIINGFSLIVFWLVQNLYAPKLFGMELSEEMFFLFCPLVQMMTSRYAKVDWGLRHIGGSLVNQRVTVEIGDVWGYLGICAVIGVVCIGLALLLYRKRNLECAGDLIAVPWLRPVFLMLYTLCVGAVFQAFFYLFGQDNQMWYLVVGLVIGFFTGKMLLERNTRVFQKTSFLQLAVFLVIFGVSLLATKWDPLGVTRWIPENSRVVGVNIYTSSSNNQYLTRDIMLTDPAVVNDIRSIHQDCLEHRDTGNNGKKDVKLYLVYRLKDGRAVSRYYYVDLESNAGQLLRGILNRPEMVLGVSQQELLKFRENLYQAYFENNEVRDPEALQDLMDAILQDAAEGNMIQDYHFTTDAESTWISLSSEGFQGKYLDIRVHTHAKHTMAWLEDHGYVREGDLKFG